MPVSLWQHIGPSLQLLQLSPACMGATQKSRLDPASVLGNSEANKQQPAVANSWQARFFEILKRKEVIECRKLELHSLANIEREGLGCCYRTSSRALRSDVQ